MADTSDLPEKQKAAKVRRKPQQESVLRPTFTATRQDTRGTLWDRNQPESDLLQRQYTCGTHTIGGAEYDTSRQQPASSSLPGSTITPANQAVQPKLLPKPEAFDDSSAKNILTGFAHDLSQIPVYTNEYGLIQPKLKVGTQRDKDEHEANPAAETIIQDSHQGQRVSTKINPEERVKTPLVSAEKIIQRDAANPDVVRWEADWNNTTFSSARRRFRGDNRPAGTPKQRYDVLCPLYKAHGISRPLKYIKDNIITVHFFQFSTPAHKDLKTPLKDAERILKAKGYTEAPLTKAWGFNARTTSAGAWSNHADGRAIDLDSHLNPHLTNKKHRRVISALTGYDIEKANPGKDSGLDSYDASKAASDIFKASYSPAGMQSRIEELEIQEVFLSNEKEVIKLELDEVPKGRRASQTDRQKAKEIKKRLKKKKGEIRAVVNQRKTLEAEIKRYEGLDTAVDTLGGKVQILQQKIELLEQGIGVSAKKKNSALRKAHRDLKKTLKALKKKEKQRDEDTLRGYASTGFLNLPKDLVEAMVAAGFRWGGDWEVHKDFMHFDL